MSGPNRPRRNIVGPQSALTDFLASHNISARQIRLDADARRQAAQQQNGENAPAEQQENGSASALTSTAAPSGPTATPSASTDSAPTITAEEQTQKTKRKKDQAKAIEKIKASKKFKKRKRDDDDDDDDVAMAIFEEQNSAPLPGQMENCALCRKRFTVTTYSRAGPDGGLLCNPCGKELDKEKKSAAGNAKGSRGRAGGRRKVQSNILDGTYRIGAKSLLTLCIQTLANNIDLAEELGDLPESAIDKISRELSRRRLLDSNTANLFFQPSADTLCIYDGARLTEDDLIRAFQMMPSLKNLKIRNAIQFKDSVMEYLISRGINLEQLHLHGSNLLTGPIWTKFLEKKGSSLKSLRVYYTDRHFSDDVLLFLHDHSPNLKRLKIQHNQQVTAAGVKSMGNLVGLEHLSLKLHNHVHSDVFVHVLDKIGLGLRTFSLSLVPTADNTVLDAIHAKCRSLQKLRITDSEAMTDEGFVRLFKDWQNKGLTFLDLQKCRLMAEENRRENPTNIGLGSDGFKALMEHSGKHLRHLNIHACRHISAQAFEEVFGPEMRYPQLTNLEISFCEQVTDFIVGSIFRSCPNLKNLNVFGCMKVKNVRVPRGKILVGVPTAVGMVIEGVA